MTQSNNSYMKRQLVKNSFSGVIQFFLTALLVFVTIPIFIKMLGSEAYGVFAVIAILGNLQIFSDLGLTQSLIKFIAQQGKTQESDYDIAVCIILVFLVSLFFTFLLIIFHNFILTHMLSIPDHLIYEAKWLFIFFVVANLFLFVGQIFVSVIDAQQKIYLTNYIRLIYSFTHWGLILLVVLLGYKLIKVGLVILLAALIWFVIISITANKIWGKLATKGLRTNFVRIAKKQVSYGSKLYVSYMLSFFHEPFTLLLISNLIGIREAGFFDIALRIKRQFVSLTNRIYYPLFPVISKISDKLQIRMLVHDIEQKVLFVVLPVVSIIFFTGKPFITLWIGTNVEIISISMISIVSVYLIFKQTIIPNDFFLIAKGYPEKNIILQFVYVFFNVFFIFITYKWIGYYAAIVGYVGSSFFYFVTSLYFQKKYLDSLIFENKIQFFKFMLIFCSCIVCGYILSSTLYSEWIKLIFIPIAISIVSIFSYRLLRVFSLEDIHRYFSFNRVFTKIGEHVLIRNYRIKN